jgi:hypothetical protein
MRSLCTEELASQGPGRCRVPRPGTGRPGRSRGPHTASCSTVTTVPAWWISTAFRANATSIECVPRSSSDARYRRELLARDLFRQPFLRSLQDKRTGVLEASLPHPTLNDATDLCQIQATAPLSDADRYVCPRSANQKDPEGVSVVSELLKENTPAVTTSLGETPAPRGPLPSSKPSDLLANSHPAAVRSAAKRPFYRPVGDEVEVFRAAARRE